MPDADDLTDEEILILEDSHDCPNCGGCLDSGLGFGMRDLECCDCTFSLSYPAERYFALIGNIIEGG